MFFEERRRPPSSPVSNYPRPQSTFSFSEAEFRSVCEHLARNEVRPHGVINLDDLSRFTRVAVEKTQAILREIGYGHLIGDLYERQSALSLQERRAEVLRRLGSSEPGAASVPPAHGQTQDWTRMNPAQQQQGLAEMLKDNATRGIPVFITSLEKQTKIPADELKSLLKGLGAKPYLTPFQIKTGVPLDSSDDYRFPNPAAQAAEKAVAHVQAHAPQERISPQLPIKAQVQRACQILLRITPEEPIGAKAFLEEDHLKRELKGLSLGTFVALLQAADMEERDSCYRCRIDTRVKLLKGQETGSFEEMLRTKAEPPRMIAPETLEWWQTPSKWSGRY